MKTEAITSLLFLIIYTSTSFSQERTDTIALSIEFPLFDLPFQQFASKTTGGFLTSYVNPSMNQSLAMSNNLYASAHFGIKSIVKPKSDFFRILLQNSIATGFDALTSFIPFGSVWLHEEYHRAVLTRRQINSFNEINTFPLGEAFVSVNKVSDEDLIRLSNQFKHDFIRLQIAGLEGPYIQIQSLQKNNFYYSQELPNLGLYWLNTMSSIIYLNQSASEDYFDDIIDEVNAEEGTDVSIRDFTGPDFTAWVSALFNPDRPYEARGAHPSGVGINRYIKPSSLSVEELNYLKRQGNLHWLNALSPHLFGFTKIRLNKNERNPAYGSFAVRHLLTSFGNAISLDVFYQSSKHNVFVSFHNYSNLNASFFGLETAVLDKHFFKDKLLFDARGMIWSQPNNHSFTSDVARIGGLVNFRIAAQLGNWFPFLALEGKTQGWVMGNVFLDQNISLQLGAQLRIKHN